MRDNLAPAVSAPNICVLLSMRTTTCKTITQSKNILHLMLSAFHFLPNFISHVYNFMLIFAIALLLLWCSELVSRRLLVRSPQSSPPVSLLQVAAEGLRVPVIRALQVTSDKSVRQFNKCKCDFWKSLFCGLGQKTLKAAYF